MRSAKCFHVAKHHGSRAAATEFVPHAIHVEPIVCQHFAAGDLFANSINQDLSTATRQASQPRIAESGKHLVGRELIDFSEVIDLWGTKAVDIYLGKALLDICQQFPRTNRA